MKRLTTPRFTFIIPFDGSNVKSLRVYFEQNDELILTKDISHCSIQGSEVSFALTQEETLKFECLEFARVQLHVLTVNGEAFLSDTFDIYVEKCLGQEVLE